jgi:branched-chain amino acid transport system ATP-binding protein
MAEALLAIAGLRKSFGALVVTDGVDLDLRAGETHAVIGPNGAGKTTLVGQLFGEIRADAGRIAFDGEDITDAPPQVRAARGIARTFQITCVLPGFSALDNVALAVQARRGSSFRFFGRAAAERALNEAAAAALDRVGLLSRVHVLAGRLAHGEKRLLELAMALAQQPRLLLLDEPMAGICEEEGGALTALLASLKGHIAILLVEHDMRAVFALADRISVLVYGRIIATGRPAEIRAHPEVRAAYLGEEEA